MKGKLKKDIVDTLKGLGVIIALFGSPIYVPFIVDSIPDWKTISKKDEKTTYTAPGIIYSGTLKRNEPVDFVYGGKTHQVGFDSLRIFRSHILGYSNSIEGLVAKMCFTLDNENIPVNHSVESGGYWYSDTNSTKTRKFEIIPILISNRTGTNSIWERYSEKDFIDDSIYVKIRETREGKSL